MRKIASFRVDHRYLEAGIYMSKKQVFGLTKITTFDIRITAPYKEPVLSTGIVHAIEHIGATYLRIISSIAKSVIYFGPMGCRTGFYLVISGNYSSKDIVPVILALFEHIRDFNGPIPGATKKECGNYTDMDLLGAKAIASHYIDNTLKGIDASHMHYPKKQEDE